MARNQYYLGLLLIAVAVLLLLGKVGLFSFLGSLWPLFILAPGILFYFLYFARILPSGVLVPGGILVTYALLFLYCSIFGWGSMGYMWPGFILGPAVGLYQFYLFDRSKPRGALIASMILAVISGVFFGFSLLFSAGVYFVAVALIAVGVFMMYRKPGSR